MHTLQVQSILGAKNATAFDLTAACSGFVIGLISAASYIRTGLYRNIIVIGADALSRYTDWRDRCELLYHPHSPNIIPIFLFCTMADVVMQCMADCFACIAATCILFGDGTGAMVLTAQQGQCSLLGIDSHSDGGGQKHLNASLLVSAPESQNQCRLHELCGRSSSPTWHRVPCLLMVLILVIGIFCHPVCFAAFFIWHTDNSASKRLHAATDLILCP